MIAEGPCHVAAPGNSMPLRVLTFVCCLGIAFLLYALYQWSRELSQPWSRFASTIHVRTGRFPSIEPDKRAPEAVSRTEPVANRRSTFIQPADNLSPGFAPSNPRTLSSKG